MSPSFHEKFIGFLTQELHLEPEAIALAQRQVQFPFQLPVSLWQYGLISLEGVNQIWTWIETHSDSVVTPTRANA